MCENLITKCSYVHKNLTQESAFTATVDADKIRQVDNFETTLCLLYVRKNLITISVHILKYKCSYFKMKQKSWFWGMQTNHLQLQSRIYHTSGFLRMCLLQNNNASPVQVQCRVK